MENLKSLDRLINSLSKLPSVGPKSAERMAYAILNMSEDEVKEFSSSLIALKSNIHPCPKCGMLIDTKECPICDNKDRDHTKLIVVSNPKDIFSIERSNGYNGLYHVINGEISLSKGKTVESINIDKLITHMLSEHVDEVILATNPTLDGETTALYIAKILQSYNVTVTRLAYGLQMGGNLDYTDQITLLKAFEGRRKI